MLESRIQMVGIQNPPLHGIKNPQSLEFEIHLRIDWIDWRIDRLLKKNDEKRRNAVERPDVGQSRTQEIEREETEETKKRPLRGVIRGRKFPPSKW